MQPTATLIETGIPRRHKLIHDIQILLLDKLSIRVESAEADLLEAGVLDSVAQVHLLLHLEKHFELHLPMESIEVDSFLSLAKIAELVESCMRAQADWPASEMPGHDLITEIQSLLLRKLSIRAEAETDLIETGVFDSMTLVQFIIVLEEHFQFSLPMEDLEIDFFHSVAKIAELVANRTRHGEPMARLARL